MNAPLYPTHDQFEDVPKNWITDDDRERIAEYLSKPVHDRDIDDLVPDGRER